MEKTVQEVIDELKRFDPQMKVIGADNIKLDTVQKTETECTENQISVKNVGFETVVRIF